jgi:hypothetical protein
LHLLTRRGGNPAFLVPIECGARLTDLIQNSVGDTHVNTRIGPCILRFEDDTDLAVAEPLIFIYQQPEPLGIALSSQCVTVYDEATPTDMCPACMYLSLIDERQGSPRRVRVRFSTVPFNDVAVNRDATRESNTHVRG